MEMTKQDKNGVMPLTKKAPYKPDAGNLPVRFGGKRRGRPDGFLRFKAADEFIRFAVEKLWMLRFNGNAIRRPYDSAEYPLPRGSQSVRAN
jgi:hypothetical protein